MSKRPRSIRPSVWTEEELIDGRRSACLVVILSTRGCAWWRSSGGCVMCGYNQASSRPDISDEDILRQFELSWQSFKGHSLVKIYTSGSFLDDEEISPELRRQILKQVAGAGASVLFESRPEFVTEESMGVCAETCKDIQLALGLESANDKVLERSIGKGFKFSDYRRAARTALDAGATIRTYLLLKPPYLTEREAVKDTIDSISKASELSKVVSINPVNVQRATVLKKMWNRGEYRPPWLWSLVEVLRNAEAGDAQLISSLVGAGTGRGAHNCGECDQAVIRSIEAYNLSQERSKLSGHDACPCRDRWRRLLEVEEFAISSGDYERFFSCDG